MSNYGYIYETTNLLNSRKYIGQKKGEFNGHYFGSGLILKQAITKYGVHSFEVKVLATAENKLKLDELERAYIADYRRIFGRKLYNISKGGTCGPGGATNKGEKCMHHKKLKLSMFVPPNELEKYRSFGWEMGKMPGGHRKPHKKDCGCTPCMVKKGIHPDGCNCYGCQDHNGRKNGMFGSHRFGEKCPVYGTRWMYNKQLDKQKMIKQDSVQKYISDGWVLGMRGK